MKVQIKKATGATVTKTQSYCEQFYPQDRNPSREKLKLQLGEFLLLLQTPLRPYERKVCLRTFESVLREYLSYKGQRL